MTPRILVLLAALAGAAGCIGDDPVETAGADPTPPTPAEPPLPEAPAGPAANVTLFNGSVAGAGNPAAGYVIASGENQFAFDVPEGVTAIVVEVAWASGDALDLQVEVPHDYCTPIDPAGLFLDCPSPPPDQDGSSPARIEVTDPEALKRVGEWSLGAWARSSANEVPFTAAVTLFHGGKPAGSYTGLPPP